MYTYVYIVFPPAKPESLNNTFGVVFSRQEMRKINFTDVYAEESVIE